MNFGAVTNLIIGTVIALLPLYIKVGQYDMGRVSKDNLLMMVFCFLLYFMPKRVRFSPCLWVVLCYGLISLSVNTWNPASINVIMQTFYVSIGILFFISYYERHTTQGLNYILNGMIVGCLTQSAIVIIGCFGLYPYQAIMETFYPDIRVVSHGVQGIGSLGNSNLLVSYVALTALPLFNKRLVWLLIFPVTALIIANSMMGLAAFAAGAVFLLNNKFKIIKTPYLYLSSVLVMGIAYIHGLWGMDSYRFSIWEEIFSRLDAVHFIFGKGPGWFADHPITIPGPYPAIHEHNEFLSLFNMFGIIGILVLAPVFIKLITKKIYHPIFHAILFAAFVNSYGHFSLHQSTTAIIILVTAAICLAGKDS